MLIIVKGDIMIKISVIVPVYNSEKYISRCLDSLVNQTLKGIEVIVVNDGSTDNSLEVLQKYSSNSVKVITQKNSGVAAARNTGLKHATGEYIAYVDSDDWVELDMFEKLYNKAIKNDYDVVMCDFWYVDDNKHWDGVSTNNRDIVTLKDKKDFMINMFPVIWNKVYKREKIRKIKFKAGVWAEDVEYLYRIMPFINKIGVINENLYYYYQREVSESRLYDKRVYNYIDNFNGIINFYFKNRYYDLYEKELEFCYVRYLYATFVKRASYFESKDDYNKAVKAAIKNVKAKFPNYRKNKYFYRSVKGIYLLLFGKLVANVYYKLVRIRRD